MNQSKGIEIEMKDQLQEGVDTFILHEGSKIIEELSSPAIPRLREVNEKCIQLCQQKKDDFHLIFAKLLYTMKQTRPDIETAIGFLCIRVLKSDKDNWIKLHELYQ